MSGSEFAVKRDVGPGEVSEVVSGLVGLGATWITVRALTDAGGGGGSGAEGGATRGYRVTGVVEGEDLSSGPGAETSSQDAAAPTDTSVAPENWHVGLSQYQPPVVAAEQIVSRPIPGFPGSHLLAAVPAYPPVVRCGDFVRARELYYVQPHEGWVVSHDARDPVRTTWLQTWSGSPSTMQLASCKSPGPLDRLWTCGYVAEFEVANPEPLSGISAVWEAMLARRERGLDECLGL